MGAGFPLLYIKVSLLDYNIEFKCKKNKMATNFPSTQLYKTIVVAKKELKMDVLQLVWRAEKNNKYRLPMLNLRYKMFWLLLG